MSLLQMSISGAVFIAAIVIMRGLAINKLPKKTFLILWKMALLRLIIPFSIPSMFSVYTLINRSVPAPALPGMERNTIIPTVTQQGPINIMQGMEQLSTNTQAPVSMWFVVWCAGMILLALFFCVSYLRCLREFQTALPVQNDHVEQWLKEHPLKRPVQVRQSDRISTPLTYGIFHPVILIPKKTDWTDKNRLQYILSHEYTHICRYDTVTKLILTLTVCVHWFNPMVWVMYILFTRDIELACDERVVRQFGETSKSAYSRMLIDMEAKRSGLSPFCNNFSKNAIEERIKAIMKIRKTSVFAIVAAAILITGAAAAFATSAAGGEKSRMTIAGYSDEEVGKLLALQFEGCEDMSVSEYQNKVWKMTDSDEYQNLMEKFSQDMALYEQKGSNETASFLFNTVEPLTAERWQARHYGGCATTDYPGASDNAIFEYTFTLTILNADTLTVREYNAARAGVANELQDVLRGRTEEQLQDNAFMQEEIDREIEKIQKQWGADKLQISVEYQYTPLFNPTAESNDTENIQQEREERYAPNASGEDYRSIFTLKTPDYQNRPVADFNMDLLAWANENHERMERIDCDTQYQDFSVNLSDDELAFLMLSVRYSGLENAKYVQSNYTGREEGEPSFFQNLPEKTAAGVPNGGSAWCDLYYQFSWRISDKETLTVGERDRSISNMITGIQTFWNETDFEQMIKMSKEDIVKELMQIAAEYSGSRIRFTISGDSVSFEKMDERGMEFD